MKWRKVKQWGLLIGGIFILVADPAGAGEITLEACLARAARESPLILKEQERVEVAKTYLAEARNSRFLPEMTLRFLTGPVTDAHGDFLDEPGKITASELTFDKLGPFLRTEFDALQPLYTFGGISSLIKAAGQGVRAEENRVEQARAELTENLVKLYLAYQLAVEVFGLQTDIRRDAEKIEAKVEEWLAGGTGKVTQTDRLRLKVFIALLEKEMLAAEKGVEQARFAFLELCGEREAGVEIPVDPLSEETPPLPELAGYLEAAKQDRPELRALEAAIRAREAQIGAVRSKMLPKFFLAGRFRYGYAPDRTPQDNPFIDDQFNFLYGGVALGLEQKFGFHVTKAALSRARAEVRQLRYSREALEMGVRIEVEKAYNNAREAAERMAKVEEGLKAGRAWMFATRENYFLGVGDIKEVIDSFGAYLAIKWQSLEAIFDYQKARMELRLASGEKPWMTDEKN